MAGQKIVMFCYEDSQNFLMGLNASLEGYSINEQKQTNKQTNKKVDNLMSQGCISESETADTNSAVENNLSQPCISQDEDPLELWSTHSQDEFSFIAKWCQATCPYQPSLSQWKDGLLA